MLKVIALVGLMASQAAAQTAEDVTVCASYGGLAADIMKHRQNGVPMSKILGVFGDDEESEKAMVKEAFDIPRFHSPAGKERAIEDYRNDIEVRCFRSKE